MKYTNNSNIPLHLAVWLVTDTYKHSSDPFTISVTHLLKPLKEILLETPDAGSIDIDQLLASRMGTAYHESIEKAFEINWDNALETLGYNNKNFLLNPKKEDLMPDSIPIYTEIFNQKKIGKWTVRGTFDFAINGQLEDLKSTSVWGWIFRSNDVKYVQQGSTYRWLNPDIITNDIMHINYLFTDWSKSNARKDNKYPQKRLLAKSFPLLSLDQTEKAIKHKLDLIDQFSNKPQEDLPKCTKEERWAKPTKYKYYKDPTKLTRSTKNFDSLLEANSRYINDGSVGIVKTFLGESTYCKYCSVNTVCNQCANYILNDGLVI